ncbi:Biogenesis of lysosome-related organelles complex 1 subunit 5 [Acipenser ruthenus]|uniref:Biogenesis of lysosome-related organelles complex 1 subunit 5 n=1 Tax=Acipenser ruthenus TaxID=7906 RepID=A0A444U426_ACIRT|nr:Biogenesis of lysosome-related organelles complex 1 subunit 5 [Acipenser ruthenus]
MTEDEVPEEQNPPPNEEDESSAEIQDDIGDIQSRLLDHRPVVQGEIRFFVREFESTKLHACQERRKAEWEAFMKEQTVKKEAMDEEHAKAVGRLSTHYSDMKKDLTKFAPF